MSDETNEMADFIVARPSLWLNDSNELEEINETEWH